MRFLRQVIHQGEGELNFHVLRLLLNGAPQSLLDSLQLNAPLYLFSEAEIERSIAVVFAGCCLTWVMAANACLGTG